MIIRKALLTFGVSLLTAAQIWVPAAVRAEMLDTQTALRDQFPAPSDRERLIVIVQRREVQAKLKEFGVSGKEALARVNSMTDGEIASIFRQIEQYAPAGADPLWRESGEKDPGYIFTIIVVLAVLGCLAFCWLLFV